jgi:uncharacterized glyoxalase superfamily protein PhnB
MLYWRVTAAGRPAPAVGACAERASGREPEIPNNDEESIVAEHMHMPTLIPALSVSDPRASLAWLEKLGFQTVMSMPMADGTIVHAHAARGDAHVMLGPTCGKGMGAPGVTLYVNIPDSVDELCARARAGGISVTQDPRDEFWGDRIFEVEHPDGYRFTFANHVRDVSEEEMKRAMDQWAAAGTQA